MADNAVFQPTTPSYPPTDLKVATDKTAAGEDVQIIKLAVSDDASKAVIPASATDGLTVNLGANNDVTVTGTVTAQDGGSSLTVDDGGSSLTVDGTVAVSGTVAVTDNSGSLTVDNPALSVTGGGVEASAVRVTIASDSTGVLSVDDNGSTISIDDGAGSITVDGTVAATQSGTWNVSNVSGTVSLPTGAATAAKQPALGTAGSPSADVITVQGVTSMTALKVDGSAVTQPVSGTVTANAGSGTMAVSLASVPSHAVTNAGTFAVQDSEKVSDNAGFTDGTTKVLPAGYILDEVAGTALSENDAGAARMDSKRAQVLTLEDATTRGQRAAVSAAGRLSVDASGVAVPVTDNSGSLTVDAPVGTPVFVRLSDGASAITALPVTDNAGSITVDNAGTFAVQATLAAGATAIAKAEDVASADADVGVPAMAVRKATPANTSGTDGDYEMLQMSAGRLWASATIDAALPAGTNAIGKLASNTGVTIGAVEIAAAQTLATVTTLTGTTTLTPGTGATNLGKAADSVAGATDTGVAVLAIRDDSLTTLTPVDGDYAPLRVNSTGALHVTGAGGGTQYQEDAAHASGDTGTMALAVRKDTATALAGTDGDYTPLITNSSGALHVAVASGSVTATGTISVDTITTSVVPGTAATNLGKAEDAAHASGDTGVMMLAVRKDTAASTAGTDGDYQPPTTDSSGRLWVNASGAAVPVTDNSGSLTVDNAGTFAVQLSPLTQGTRVALIDVDESEDEIKATAGTLYSFILTNLASSTRYVRFYNATAASVTVGTTTIWYGPIAIPAGAGVAFAPAGPGGLAFSTALCIAATTGVAENDTGAPGANEVVASVVYA